MNSPEGKATSRVHALPFNECSAFRGLVQAVRCRTGRPTILWLLPDPRDSRAIVAAASGIEIPAPTASVRVGDASIVGQTLAHGKSRVATRESMSLGPQIDPVESREFKASLCVAVKAFGRVEAAIQQFALAPMSDIEAHHIDEFLGLASAILEDWRRVGYTESLTRTFRRLRAAPDLEVGLQVIADSARSLVQADSCEIYFPDRARGGLGLSARSPTTSLPESNGEVDGGDGAPLLPTDDLSNQIIDDKRDTRIDDTREDDRARALGLVGRALSLLGVRIQLGTERVGVLYVGGTRAKQFTNHDLRHLRSLADHASVAFGWAQQLLQDSAEFDRAAAMIASSTTRCAKLCEALQAEGKNTEAKREYDFAAVQLIRRVEQVIETVAGRGEAEALIGRARHYLFEEEGLRDIQTDIALRRQNVEIIVGDDPRFDQGVFDEFGHRELVRVFAPLVLVRNRQGEISKDWWLRVAWKQDGPESCFAHETECATGTRQILHFDLPDGLSLDEDGVLGTVEVGYRASNLEQLGIEEAKRVLALASRHAPVVHDCSIEHVLEKVADRARRMLDADSTTVHFLQRGDRSYVYRAASGELGRIILKDHPPRTDSFDSLGKRAQHTDAPSVVPDPWLSENLDVLKTRNQALYSVGVKAMVAFPMGAGGKDGVLYAHFRKPHCFAEAELAWVGRLTRRAREAVDKAMRLDVARDQARQLLALHKISQSLVDPAECGDSLLRHIASEALNLVGADVVTLYEYVEADEDFRTPPIVAGKLRKKLAMREEIKQGDSPEIVVGQAKPIWKPIQGRGSFLEREAIHNAACIPLLVAGETVGVLFINYRRPHSFSEGEKTVIETLGSAAAIAIKNRRIIDTNEAVTSLGHMAFSGLHYVNGLLGAIKQKAILAASSDIETEELEDIRDYAEKALENLGQVRAATAREKRMIRVKDIVRRLKELAVTDVNVSLSTPCALAQVTGHLDVLAHAIYIPVQNAIEGGADTVVVRIQKSEQVLKILVCDDAGGIPVETRSRVFSPDAKSPKDYGWGLGLYWARTYIETLGGKMRIVDVGEDGCALGIELPIAEGTLT